MNSPPPPSFTVPTLSSKGQYPVTPEESPTGNEESKDYLSAKSKGKGKASEEDIEAEVRVSMYVRLFEEMIQTVLASESYLFTDREHLVLSQILNLPYEPKYLLTRLLLRRPGRIFPFTSLLPTYETEIGPEGIRTSMRNLSEPIQVPQYILDSEPPIPDEPPDAKPENPHRDPVKISPKKKRKISSSSSKPWAHIATGLSAAEEKADPDLAEAIRESIWAEKVGRMELDDEGVIVASPPPERPFGPSRSVSGSSSSSNESKGNSRVKSEKPGWDEVFSLDPKPPPPVLRFAKDERDMNLEEIMSCISAEELRRIAKARKIPLAMLSKREDVCTALRGIAQKQTVLAFTPVKGKQPIKESRQSKLPFSSSSPAPSPPTVTSESLLISQLLPLIGAHAIQLSQPLHNLIARVNLIFSRTPPLPGSNTSLMLPSILVTSHRRRYPSYGSPTRSMIWTSREELLRWERTVYWEGKIQDALGENWQEMRKAAVMGTSLGIVGQTASWNNKNQMLGRVEGANIVKRIWEGVWPIWLELVHGKGGDEVDVKHEQGGLVGDRFKTGHVLTRIVYKSAVALGLLHEYDLEVMVLKALISQRRWRRSKRGAWYDRLALVLMNHYNASPEEKEAKCREAVQVCIDALLDNDTHLIYRPGLSRRLTRLENKLNLPADERHISHASLLVCETRELTAPRVPENLGQPKLRPRVDSNRDREGSMGEEEGLVGPAGLGAGRASPIAGFGWQQTGKSVWVGRESEVTVEGWVLEWWEKKGYKGFHSEGSIMTTLFTLLLWPILFHPLPGAFETAYQTAPLDLGEDTFAPARQFLLEQRLSEMSSTKKAIQMLRETDDRERPNLTWAVGVNWEYQKSDLEELLECLGGKAMSGVCRMLAEEYRHRVSGVPDLIVWKYDEKLVRFVEVKGPGDQLSETQKIWIDVLLSSGIPVEVCRVKAKDATDKDTDNMKKRKAKTEKQNAGQSSKNGWGNAKNAKAELDDEGHEVDRSNEDDDEGEKDPEFEKDSRTAVWERTGKRIRV